MVSMLPNFLQNKSTEKQTQFIMFSYTKIVQLFWTCTLNSLKIIWQKNIKYEYVMNNTVYTLAFTTEGSLNAREIYCFMKSLLLLTVLAICNYAMQLLIVV